MFLKILGIIFLIVLAILAFYIWKIYRLVKKTAGSEIQVALSVLPDQDMDLMPSTRGEWKEKDKLDFTESELKKIGAALVGYYCVYHGCAIIRVSLWNFKDQVAAVVYEGATEQDEDNVSYIYEVACNLDVGSVCITSNPHAVYDNRPEEHKIVFSESKSIVDFIKQIKNEIPAQRRAKRIADIKDFFVECYEDTAEWGWRPEQLKSDKTLQVLSSVGVKVTDEIMDELIDMGELYSMQINVNRAKRKLAKQTKMSVEEWEKIRDRLVYVNEKMRVDHLVEAIYDLAGELSEIQEQALEGFGISSKQGLSDPIGAFQMLLQSLNLKVKRVVSLDKPVKTEVFLPLQ